MFRLFIFTVLFVHSYAFSVRIVNGTDAQPGEFPFIVSLRRNQTSHTCGASILNENFILTAAHCVCDGEIPMKASEFTIQYGTVNISEDMTNSIQVNKIYCNTFSYSELIFDSAVLQLESSIPEGDNWKPVEIAKQYDTSIGQEGIIIGWGRLWPNGPIATTLQKLTVNIYPDAVCAMHDYYGIQFKPEHHICLGAPIGGACNGDSGSPLLAKSGLQIGTASFVTSKCGPSNENTPNVYARVSRYYDWIKNITGLN